jgi:hypothetical protein
MSMLLSFRRQLVDAAIGSGPHSKFGGCNPIACQSVHHL